MNRVPGLPEAIEPSLEMYRYTFDLALLRTFTAIVEAGSMARAAERVARSQPAVSLQMKKLEDVIGGAVLRKNGRRLMLTEVGETLFAYAKRLLELNDEAVAAVSAIGLAGAVRLGIAQDFAEGCLTNVLARFARAHPAVVIEVCADRNAVLQERLARHQLDIVLTFGEESSGHLQVLGSAPVAWIGLPDAQMDPDRRIALVVFEAPCYFRQVAIQTLESVGMSWRIAFSSLSLSSQWSAVAAGLGVMVRTPIGLKAPLQVLGCPEGWPALPSISVSLYVAEAQPEPVVGRLQAILTETIQNELAALTRSNPFRSNAGDLR